MEFVLYKDWEQLPERANALFEQAEKDSIYFSRSWFECLVSAGLEADHEALLACVVEDNCVLAILPAMESGGNQTWYSLRHGYTPVYSLLVSDKKREQVLSFLAEELNQRQVNGLLLEPVASDDSNVSGLKTSLEALGYDCEYRFRDYNWIYRVEGRSYAEYLAERPAQLRNTIARKKRKLEREHGYEIRLFTGDEVMAAMPGYYRVYDASWKQNELKNAGFLDNFVEAFSREGSPGKGWTRLAILYVKDQPVAAQVWFVRHGKASIFRLAYDKGWRKYSVGSILTSFLMEYVIDTDKVDEIDFLTGNDAYKQDWMSERRERYLLSCIKTARPEGLYGRLANFIKKL